MSSATLGFGLPATATSGLCALADPAIVSLHLLSDIAIGLAYLSIPAVLVVVLLRRRDLAYPWILGLFAAFIVACGGTHLMHAWTMFRPAPEAEALLKALTAAISVTVAVTLWPVLPRLLALRSPAALAREVEERRAAEERARASEARIAALFANLSEALFVVRFGPDGRPAVETVNPAFERIFGIPQEKIANRPVETVMPPALRDSVLPRWLEAARTGEVVSYEATAEVGGTRRWWHTVLVPLRGAGGEVERLLGSARDMTATRKMQAGLVQSARMATVGAMCAGLAHEASQPLNTATLWLRRLRVNLIPLPEAQGAPLARAVAVVEEQLRRAGELVARIRTLSAEAPQETREFDAAGPAAAALRAAKARHAAEGIGFTLDAPEGPLPVRGSPARLEQAIGNILANARDAVADRRSRDPGAPARVTLRLRAVAGAVAIEVRDTGTGIPEGLEEAIFDPFFTTREPGRGTGLGLTFAASVARAMGGGIEAWTPAEGGACVRMELAAAEREADAPVRMPA